MTMTARRYGAQSMTAPLRDVLVKRPGEAFGRAFDDPAHGFLHPVDLDVARREHDAFVDVLAGLGPTVHVLDARDRRSRSRLHVRSAARDRSRRDPAAPRQAEPGRRAGDPRGLDRGRRHPDRSAGSRRPGPSRAATRSGCGPTCSASAGRCARTRAGSAQLAELVGGDVRVFDVPYWKGPAELHPPPERHLAGRRRPGGRVPAAPAGRPVGAAGRARYPARRGPRRGVPDARLQRPGRPARRGHHGRGQSRARPRRWRPPAARSTPTRRPRSGSTARVGRPA